MSTNNNMVSVRMGLNGVQTVAVQNKSVGEALHDALRQAGQDSEYAIVQRDGEGWRFAAGSNLVVGLNASGSHTPNPNEPAENYESFTIDFKRKNG